MKVLVLTHIADIDGMGCAILAKQAPFFDECDVEFVNYNDINQRLDELFVGDNIYKYDRVFITDICPNDATLNKIWRRNSFSSTIRIIDHHEMAVINGAGNYSFVTLKTKDEKGMCSGTSLFYEYLQNNAIIAKNIILICYIMETHLYFKQNIFKEKCTQ